MLDRLLSATVAVCLALLVWLYLRSRDQDMLDNVPIPVNLMLAPGQAGNYDLEITSSSQVPVSFTGPPSRIRELRNLLQRGALHVDVTLTVPEDRLKESRYLDTVRVEPSAVHAPPGVTPILSEGRNHVSVTLYKLAERRLPVRFEPPSEEHVLQAALDPAVVLVRGPQEILDRLRALPTQPFALPARPEAAPGQEAITTVSVPLVQELEGRPIQTRPRTVTARLTLQPRQKLYDLAEIPVHFLCPANFSLRPLFSDERAGKITLRLLGPAVNEPPAVTAYIDLSGRKWEAGLYEEALKVHLPRDFELAQKPPKMAAFQLVPALQPPKVGGIGTAP